MFWLWLVLIQIFIFTLLVVFLRILLTRNVSTATEHLHELNQDYNEKVESANKKKAEVDSYYNEMLLKAKADAEKQKVAILREAQTTQEAVLKDARRKGEEIIANAAKAQETALAEIETQINNRALDLSSKLLTQVLTRQMSEYLHALWIEELFKTGFEDIDKLHIPDDVASVVVQTPYSLNMEQKNFLEKRFESLIGKPIVVEEELVPDLAAGIRISMGSLLIDGSLRYKISKTAQEAKRV